MPKDELDDELGVKLNKAVEYAIDLNFPALKKKSKSKNLRKPRVVFDEN